MLKEIQHLLRTEILDIQIAHRSPSLCGNETQQQDERVTVALDGVWTGPAYARKMIRKEATQGTAKRIGGCGVHRTPPALAGIAVTSAPQ